MNEILTSLQNPQVKAWRALNKSRSERVKQGLFLAEGEHMAQEAIKEKKARALLMDAGAREKFCSLEQAAQGLPIFVLAPHVMAAICDAKTPQGVVALCSYPHHHAPETLGDWLIALDGVQDPGNVGTILRTMDAAGFTGLLMDEKCADPYSPKALRSSMGGVFRVPAVRCENLADSLHALAGKGYEIIAGDLHGAPFYQRPKAKEKICIIIGNEGAGISPAVMAEATLRLKLPIVGGAESLNAGVAGAVMMYDFLRERLG